MKDSITIKAQLVRELINAMGDIRAIAVGAQGGYALRFLFGDSDRTLVNSHGSIRYFASLDTAGVFMQSIGISNFEVDMTHHQRGRLRKARPDRAEAMRLTRTRLRQQALEFSHAEPSRV